MVTIYAFGILLVLLAATLVVSHWRAWQRAKRDATLGEAERQFAWRQCRRRTQASGMIGLAGAAMCVYELIPRNETVVTLYLGGLILLVLWIMLLAVGDVLATRSHYGRLRRQHQNAQARLAKELDKHLQHSEDADRHATSSNR